MGLMFADVMADSILVEFARAETEDNKGIIQSWSWTCVLLVDWLHPWVAFAYDHLGATRVFDQMP